jgi:hypothetical protein
MLAQFGSGDTNIVGAGLAIITIVFGVATFQVQTRFQTAEFAVG